jgi:hypothetical protein
LPFNQLAILSNCFINLSSHQINVSTKSHFINFHLTNLPFYKNFYSKNTAICRKYQREVNEWFLAQKGKENVATLNSVKEDRLG